MSEFTPVRVAVGSMRLDPPLVRTTGRARYLITLQCGCSWWEEYGVEKVPARVGDPADCYARGHIGWRGVLPHREIAAVYVSR